MARLVPFQPTADVAEFADIIIDSATLLVDGVQLSVSRGGWTFDEGAEWEDYAFPGKTMSTVGARSLVRLKPVIKGTALLSGEDQITAFRPDGTWANHASIAGARTFTPNALRAYLTDADYLENVICIWKRIRGDYIAVEFPFAVCGSWGIGATDGDEGTIQITIEAVQENAGTGTTRTRLPYRIRKVPTTDDATAPPLEPEIGDPIHDVSALDLVLADGAPVTTWPDTAGSNDMAPDAGVGQSAPTYDETGWDGVLPAVVFDGVNDGLGMANQITSGSFSTYIVAKDIVVTAGTLASFWNGGDGYPFGKGVFFGNGTIPTQMAAHVNTHVVFDPLVWVADDFDKTLPHIYRFTFSQPEGLFKLFVDGVEKISESCNPNITETDNIWMGVIGADKLSMVLAQEVTYDGYQPAAGLNSVELALQTVWGVP
jgi:hypothetical protein